jgi:hypothetical protein
VPGPLAEGYLPRRNGGKTGRQIIEAGHSLARVSTSGDSDMVRRGYDALSYHYRSDDAGEDGYAPWLSDLKARLPASGRVLDLGCGCGCPSPGRSPQPGTM